ncbi:MAG: MerR family transcriptional regulator [Pseudomonadales bacterium]
MQELESRTGVGREAIRFYIREGMLPEPEKPKRNVAIYSEEHVKRIKLIRELQEKRFLPLKHVKAVLEAPDTQSLIAAEGIPGIEHFLPALLDSTPGADKSLAEVAQSSGLSESEIEQIAEAGVVQFSKDRVLDFRDATIIERWGAAKAAGYTQEHGYDPTFLKKYATLMKEIADHEVDVFLGSLGKGRDGREAAQIGANGVNIANELMSLLHNKMVLEALNERVGSGQRDHPIADVS